MGRSQDHVEKTDHRNGNRHVRPKFQLGFPIHTGTIVQNNEVVNVPKVIVCARNCQFSPCTFLVLPPLRASPHAPVPTRTPQPNIYASPLSAPRLDRRDADPVLNWMRRAEDEQNRDDLV